MSARLQDRFSLQHALVVDTPDDEAEGLRRHLGRAAAQLLGEIVTPQDVLGVAWAFTVSAIAGALPRLPGTPVVQLTGVLPVPNGSETVVDVVRAVAAASGGAAHVFYAPFTVSDAATARALRQQADVAEASAQLPNVTKAVAGVGLWEPGQSLLHDSSSEIDRRELARLGVCAELSGVFLSEDGDPIRTELSERMIGITGEELRAIPEVIIIAHGPAKLRAVRTALRSGLANGLVTHGPSHMHSSRGPT